MIFDASSLYILLKRGNLRSLTDFTTLDLAFYEVGNALLRELRRRLVTPESFGNTISVLGGISELMNVESYRELDAKKVSEISKSTSLTFYDASYLTLALTSNDILATNDDSLSDEAHKLGVRTVSV